MRVLCRRDHSLCLLNPLTILFSIQEPSLVIPLTPLLRTLLSLSLFCLGAPLSCKDDSFKDAPSIQASAKSEAPGQPPQGGAAAAPAGKLAPGQDAMPPDHPPVPGAAVVVPQDKAPRPQVPVTANADAGAPLTWSLPTGWKSVTPSSAMRMAQMVVPGPQGSESGELTVFYFGPGGGGGVEANITRWIGQFKQPDGSPADALAKRDTKQVGGMKVDLVDVSGTFNAGAAMMGGAQKTAQRALGAIVDSPKGLVFFKLVGPSETVAQNEAAFSEFVHSIKAP